MSGLHSDGRLYLCVSKLQFKLKNREANVLVILRNRQMNSKLWKLWILTAPIWATAGLPAMAAANPPAVVENLCSVCHGPGGNSISPRFPRLAAQQPEYLEAQLKAFRDHTRADPDARDFMWGWARLLSDADIKQIAAYYASQKPVPGTSSSPILAARGKTIYELGIPSHSVPACVVCHQANAEGKDTFPRLASQHAAYIVKQLEVFHSPLRPAAVAMSAIVTGITNDDAEAVAAYLQSR